jgi:hypothetical protein
LVRMGPIDWLKSQTASGNRVVGWRFSDVAFSLRIGELMVALRLYQAEVGKPAATLEELTPKYLASVPVSPVDLQPIRYRLSRGEEIGAWGSSKSRKALADRKVLPGQGILYDGASNFVVPLPANR